MKQHMCALQIKKPWYWTLQMCFLKLLYMILTKNIWIMLSHVLNPNLSTMLECLCTLSIYHVQGWIMLGWFCCFYVIKLTGKYGDKLGLKSCGGPLLIVIGKLWRDSLSFGRRLCFTWLQQKILSFLCPLCAHASICSSHHLWTPYIKLNSRE